MDDEILAQVMKESLLSICETKEDQDFEEAMRKSMYDYGNHNHNSNHHRRFLCMICIPNKRI